jgi:hypothetical protein
VYQTLSVQVKTIENFLRATIDKKFLDPGAHAIAPPALYDGALDNRLESRTQLSNSPFGV